MWLYQRYSISFYNSHLPKEIWYQWTIPIDFVILLLSLWLYHTTMRYDLPIFCCRAGFSPLFLFLLNSGLVSDQLPCLQPYLPADNSLIIMMLHTYMYHHYLCSCICIFSKFLTKYSCKTAFFFCLKNGIGVASTTITHAFVIKKDLQDLIIVISGMVTHCNFQPRKVSVGVAHDKVVILQRHCTGIISTVHRSTNQCVIRSCDIIICNRIAINKVNCICA